MFAISLPNVQGKGICALAEEPAENDGVGKACVSAEGKALCVRPLEKLDETLWREGPGARKAEETSGPGGGSISRIPLIEKTGR